MHDLTPATDQLAVIVRAIDDGSLAAPTPCDGLDVADLLHHVHGLADAFARAARKQPSLGGPTADGANLVEQWRDDVPRALAELAQAWHDPAAWDGTAEIAGLTMPGAAAGAVAVNEVIVHGWDLARATGRPFHADRALVELALSFVEPTAAAHPAGTPGLFGAAVPIPGDAPVLDRLLALTGRDPGPAAGTS